MIWLYDAMFLCSTALLRGLELQSGPTRVRLSESRDAYDQARFFIATVGNNKALLAARRALGTTTKKVRWL